MDVYVDLEETDEKQKERIQGDEHLGNEHFSERRIAEISVDLVLQPRARLCNNKVDGLKDKFASEMLERLQLAKVYKVASFFSGTLHVKGGPVGLLDEARRKAEEGDQELQGHCIDGSCVKVVRDVCCLSHGRRSRTEGAGRTARGRGRRYLLPAPPSIDDQSIKKTLGMVRTQRRWVNQNMDPIGNQLRTWPVWTTRRRLTLISRNISHRSWKTRICMADSLRRGQVPV